MSARGISREIPAVLTYFGAIVWRHRPSYFLLIAGNMLLQGLSPFVNIVIPKFIIDELLGARRTDVLTSLVALLLAANVVIYLLNNLRDYLVEQARFFFDRKLEELIGQKAMEMDFEYTENAEVLTQLQKAKTGVTWYSGGIPGLGENLTAIVAGVMQFGGTLYIIAALSPWLIAFMLGIVALSMVVTSKSQKAYVQFMKDLVGINRRFGYYFGLLKNVQFAKDIRLYDARDLFIKRVDKYVDDDWRIQDKRTAVQNRFDVAQSFLGATQQAVLYGYLGLQALSGSITIGDFQMLVGAVGAFSQSLTQVLEQIIQVGKNADFMNEYKAFMEYPAARRSGAERPPDGAGRVIAFRDVSFHYPGSDETALCNVSLEIPAGQRLAVVGPNGAGKTTFVKLLTRLYDPVAGAILLDGRDIREFDFEAYTKLFAVVFQDFKLFSFSLRDNLTFGSEHGDEAVRRALQVAGLEEKVSQLPRHLDTPVHKTFEKDGVDFSGGESQKLAIARAVFRNAPIVILDEPTAALDPIAEYEVYRHFDRLVDEKTAIYISHRLSSCRFCDRIAVFDQGRIVEYGTHDDLLAYGGLYARLWQTQAQWYVAADA